MKRRNWLMGILAALLAVLWVEHAQAQALLRGERGRVVVLDASGSMNQNSFASQPRARWNQALLSLEELMDQLSLRGDKTPTAFMIFGDEGVWEDVREQYGSPQDYPPEGRLCQDVQVLTNFAEPTNRLANQVTSLAERATPSGMTPIPRALSDAIDLLDPAYGGEIILISDMEDPNCLIEGQSLCSAIENRIARFREEDGTMRLRFRVLATPAANIADALAECGPSSTVDLPSNDPDHAAAVAELLGGVQVQLALRAIGAENIDRDGIDSDGLKVFAEDRSNGARVAAGPPGTLVVPAGELRFVATDGSNEWAVNARVSGPGQFTIPVVGGRLTLNGVDSDGNEVTALSAVEVLRPGLGTVWTDQGVTLPLSLDVGAGMYVVRGRAAGYGDAQTQVPVQLARSSNATLTFGTRATASEVTVTVSLGTPTLEVGRGFEPAVTLSGGGLSVPRVLAPGPNTLVLEPGLYEATIAANRPHSLNFAVPPGAAPLEVDLFLPPGRVFAEAQEAGGEFELQDASGKPLYSFGGRLIEHGLPDGNYRLVYRSRSGDLSAPQTFEINAGDLVQLQF